MHRHRAHDYRFLLRRWRKVARQSGLRLEALDPGAETPTYFLRSARLQSSEGIYISAAIHGDEPASSEALIAWAELNPGLLRQLPLFLLPCLNPWGLTHNRRLDAAGNDLNRSFGINYSPVITALEQLLVPYRFSLALCLHEDFDAQGLYLYEVIRERPFWGESLLEVASGIIPIEPRPKVDGHKAAAGLIRRRFSTRQFQQTGFPEALWLHRHHARRAITLETPSEFALDQRVRAQVAVIERCVELTSQV